MCRSYLKDKFPQNTAGVQRGPIDMCTSLDSLVCMTRDEPQLAAQRKLHDVHGKEPLLVLHVRLNYLNNAFRALCTLPFFDALAKKVRHVRAIPRGLPPGEGFTRHVGVRPGRAGWGMGFGRRRAGNRPRPAAETGAGSSHVTCVERSTGRRSGSAARDELGRSVVGRKQRRQRWARYCREYFCGRRASASGSIETWGRTFSVAA
jgi:hypothetical protein